MNQTQLGSYLLLEQVGRGGAAAVYRARQESLGRDVAVKVLHRDVDPQFAARFVREARAIAALQHPNILPVYDFGEQDDMQYLVMRYVPGGRTLRDELAGGPLEPAHALQLMIRLLDALEYAHQHGVIHRDIKPGNVLLPAPDWPLLADFGIARFRGETQLTLAGQAIGTPDYMSPEQASGQAVDARSDVYSAGAMLYEMLTGRPPFGGDSALAVVMQHMSQPPASLRLLNPALPHHIEAPVLRALAKNPDERFGSAREMARALEQVATQPEPVPSARPQRDQRPVPPGNAAWSAPVPAGAAERGSVAAPPPATPSRSRLPRPLLLGLVGLLLLGGLALAFRGGTGSDGAVGDLSVRLDDGAWQGGYRYSDGRTYGGRSATWIYGSSTAFNTMRAGFELSAVPQCVPELRVEGMDSEGRAKTTISVAVNGVEIYAGPNPLPDDDLPLESGTWATHAFQFDGGLLRVGTNEIAITNLEPGAFGLPPFFMLDYAELVCGA
jgi:tRNA A-37 threonylcarbamoyl transferase component Bud32